MMQRIQRPLVGIMIAGLLAVAACVTAPYTNRSQFILLSPAQEAQLGVDAFQQVLSQEPVMRSSAATDLVQDVGWRIAQAADRPDFEWEFRVIQDAQQANAFALPGGKVAVYTGLFPIAQDSGGLAAVLAHEIGHVLARHGAERMSQGTMLQLLQSGLAMGLGGQSEATRNAVMQAFGLGAQVGVMLPFGRSQESEADHIGLILMAQAGYDPIAALHLWERFEQAERGSQPEFLSTHPHPRTRQDDIRSWLEEARGHYRPQNAARIVMLPGASGY